jgi:HTH-type transcriptional regulator/antitoxin HipB
MLVRTPEDLGQLIRERRRELGLDQRSLAERVGVSRLWIIEFEKGKPRAEIGLVLRTLNALELSLEVASDVERRRTNARAPRKRTAPPDIDAIVSEARKRGR